MSVFAGAVIAGIIATVEVAALRWIRRTHRSWGVVSYGNLGFPVAVMIPVVALVIGAVVDNGLVIAIAIAVQFLPLIGWLVCAMFVANDSRLAPPGSRPSRFVGADAERK